MIALRADVDIGTENIQEPFGNVETSIFAIRHVRIVRTSR